MPLYARYGLRDNPFYYELNPLERAEDARLYARVAGFQRIMDSIDQRLAERVLRKRPAFLLLSGGSGSGRTALARYALAKYRELRAIESCRFMVPLVQLDHSMKTTVGHPEDSSRTARDVEQIGFRAGEFHCLDEIAACVELLEPVVAAIGDPDMAVRADLDPARSRELTIA
jgi:tRNA A37 threonylcarbamoyladenosine biosynthesis protein TsaE